jgi:hypothetical protein
MITYDLGDTVGPGDEGVSDYVDDKEPEVGDRIRGNIGDSSDEVRETKEGKDVWTRISRTLPETARKETHVRVRAAISEEKTLGDWERKRSQQIRTGLRLSLFLPIPLLLRLRLP